MPLPDLPELKHLRGFGMSDTREIAKQLTKKLRYTNTYFHEPPRFDVLQPPETEWGQHDFIICSEVLEHVPPPVDRAFANLHRLLKPGGVLLLTVPYSLWPRTVEHFPALHDFAVVTLGGRWVLVNRTADGHLETHENLVFHGGPGSTLEMRVFNEVELRRLLTDAGFTSIRIDGQNYAENGIFQDEPWSLPIAARKGGWTPSVEGWREFGARWWDLHDKYRVTKRELKKLKADYQNYTAFAEKKVKELEAEMARRAQWGEQLDQELQQKSADFQAKWQAREAESEALAREFEQRTAWAQRLDAELAGVQQQLDALERRRWVRWGRRLGLLR